MLLLSFSLYASTVRVVVILVLASIIYWIAYWEFNKHINQQIADRQILAVDATKRAFLTAGFRISLSAAFIRFLIELQSPFLFKVEQREILVGEILVVGVTIMTSLAVTGIPLIDSIVFKPKRMLANYRKSRPNLIKR
jgi:hypothetical protein